MKTRSLRSKIQLSFLAIIVIFASLIAIFGYWEIKNNVIARAQRQVRNDLKIARWFYYAEIERIRLAFNIVTPQADLEVLKDKIGLDYLNITKKEDKGTVKSEIVLAAFEGQPSAGTRVIGPQELLEMDRSLYDRSVIEIKATQKARPTNKKILDSAMAIGYAKPIFDSKGEVESVMYGGKIINRDLQLVDNIRDFVFENKIYGSKPTGTVTIFLDDVRVATNVLDSNQERAIGTRVSETVYKKVVEEGRPWIDRAFVVTDWYLTAYEPIRNIRGEVIGVLYVGTLERPFTDMQRNIFFVYSAIVLLASGLAVVISFILANAISRPLTMLLGATARVSGGDLEYRINTADKEVRELDTLAESFNNMAAKLSEREKNLEVINEKLGVLNKSYLDLITFVAHELKGILSSTILNAYTVRDGFLGMVNFKQRKTLDSIARNLDYFSSTVKNFLDLSRIEKGELTVNKRELLLKEDILEPVQDSFAKQAEEKGMGLLVKADQGMKVGADRDLLQIVVNNLVGNAIKYGCQDGSVVISASCADDRVRVEVYNDGPVIAEEQKGLLFKKFSRLYSSSGKKVKGTGLGLFIAKEIIEKHGGRIWLETRQTGNAFIFEIGL